MTSTGFPSESPLVIDTSALIALMLEEEAGDRIEDAVFAAARVYMSAPTLVEATIVAAKPPRGDAGRRLLDTILARLRIEVVPFDEKQSVIARHAHERFGRGNHPARLNFGDCFSYALAKHLELPLLFLGNDFAQTDVVVVRY